MDFSLPQNVIGLCLGSDFAPNTPSEVPQLKVEVLMVCVNSWPVPLDDNIVTFLPFFLSWWDTGLVINSIIFC